MNIKDVAVKVAKNIDEFVLEPLTNPYYWLSILAALVVNFTIYGITGSEAVAFVAAFLALLAMPSREACAEWRGGQISRRWAEETAQWVRDQGDEARVEYDRYGVPTLFVTLASPIDRVEVSQEITL